MIALIVVGVLLLLVIIAGITCYLKKDELVKYGTTAMVTGIKTDLNENPVAGVDTVRVNAITDAFIEKLNESEVDYDKYGHFGQTLQAFQSDKVIDSAEAEQFVQAMIEYFPELEQLLPLKLKTPPIWRILFQRNSGVRSVLDETYSKEPIPNLAVFRLILSLTR